jgi:Flp pilus assembly protein TadB
MDIAYNHTRFHDQALARASFADAAHSVSASRVAPVVAAEAPTDPERSTRFGEHAARDLPATVGWMIVASYASILAAFGWAFFGAADVMFNIGVCAVYLAVYLGVPWIFLKGEPDTSKVRQPDFAEFLEQGLSTWTGHVSGGAALAQMLTIPVAVAFAALGLGVIIRLSA